MTDPPDVSSQPDPIERRLLTIWQQVLELDGIGVLDDFLELGGDSLAAITIIARVRDEFGEELDAFEFMDAGTVRGVAKLVRDRRQAAAGARDDRG